MHGGDTSYGVIRLDVTVPAGDTDAPAVDSGSGVHNLFVTIAFEMSATGAYSPDIFATGT